MPLHAGEVVAIAIFVTDDDLDFAITRNADDIIGIVEMLGEGLLENEMSADFHRGESHLFVKIGMTRSDADKLGPFFAQHFAKVGILAPGLRTFGGTFQSFEISIGYCFD
jgi:hypothetical protein